MSRQNRSQRRLGYLIDTSDFKNGLSIIIDGDIYTIVDFQHVKPGKGPAFVRSKLKNARSGAVIDKTWRAGEKMEQAVLDRRTMDFLYSMDGEYHLMDKETFDQISVPELAFGSVVKYLKENTEISVLLHNGNVISIELPASVELEVTETSSSERGNTAQGGSKPATLETGAVVQVPFFINVGDKLKVDTRTDTYLERVK